MRRSVLAVLALLLVAACEKEPAPDMRAVNPAKYDRDSAACRDQVNAETRNRRMADAGRRGTFSGDRDRFGQGALPEQMDAYSDSKSTERIMSDCMAAYGWSSRDPWWKKVGQPHTF